MSAAWNFYQEKRFPLGEAVFYLRKEEEKINQLEVLQKYFGYDAFRPGQEEVINSILSGRDTLAILPTGAGKSLCFQVPALMLEGLTLVISPLIALMRDQVEHLQAAGIEAACVDSASSQKVYRRVLEETVRGKYHFLYVSPERLQNKFFQKDIGGLPIKMVVIDEAHCVSQWGHDFRPAYLKIAEFLALLPERPYYTAFTATATPAVEQDLIRGLHLRQPAVIKRSFDRPNLYWETASPPDKDRALLSRLDSFGKKSGLVYCATRRLTEKVTRLLQNCGYRAARYHAGLTPKERELTRERFVRDQVQIIVATNAFGMGIDKENVDFVIHYNMPLSLEAYYQEAGRAGRNGQPALCLLYYSRDDRELNERLAPEKLFLLEAMWKYCLETGCLRHNLLAYFGEKSPAVCGHCGGCCQEGVTRSLRKLAERCLNSCLNICRNK